MLLGLVVEAVTGQSLVDALNTRIFKPLGLGGTIYPSSSDLPPPTPTGYAVDVTSQPQRGRETIEREPRKTLGYQTPADMFSQSVASTG